MENETVNQEKTGSEEQNEDKTFTQAEVNAMVSERLKRERAKYADYDDLKTKAQKYDESVEASKSELQKATEQAERYKKELDSLKKAEAVRTLREKVSTETGVPASLLTGENEEDCKAQAEAIMKFANPDAYPAVKDNGELHGTGKLSTRDQFAQWAAKQNV